MKKEEGKVDDKWVNLWAQELETIREYYCEIMIHILFYKYQLFSKNNNNNLKFKITENK